MVVGFDVHHPGAAVGSGSDEKPPQSVGAMVSTTSDSHGSFYSCVSFFERGTGLSGNMAMDISSELI